ncbi:MAG TPA: hypothetical protein VEW05_07815 [Candidatus Polarisedimenticolia bacterium]|nr:hypothetical protein [Candidatus Polarisedimenticolia bacterium]
MSKALVALVGSGTSEERIVQIENYLNELSLHRDSRRGPEGPRGHQGEQGPQGAPADPKQVAEIATELVKKAFRFETQIAKFESLLKDLESEIAAVKAALRWAVIEELKLGGVLDAEGRAVPGPAGADSHVPGPKGDKGDAGLAGPAGKDGVDGRDGRDGADGQSVVGPQGPTGKDSTVPGPKGERGEIGPEGLQGYPGEGVSKTDVVEIVRDMKRRGTI